MKKDILKKTYVTEKSNWLSGNVANPAYTFLINKEANKPEVRAAFIEKYKLKPLGINIIHNPKNKKAVVYLKKGDKIDFV